MQIKVFTIPMLGGEGQYDEMNAFLRGRKILQVENHIVNEANGALWTFCIKYVEGSINEAVKREEGKIDYAEVLDGESFKRFSKMRDARMHIAKEDKISSFLIFLNEELANMSKMEELTLVTMKTVKGIGDKKVEKYGQRFLDLLKNEKS